MVDQGDYDELRGRPDVLLRGAIEHTCTFVTEHDPELAKRLARLLGALPIMPPDATGHSPYRDYYVVDLSFDEVQGVLQALRARRVALELSLKPPIADGAFALLGALVDEWSALADFLRGDAPEAAAGPSATPPPTGPRDFDLN